MTELNLGDRWLQARTDSSGPDGWIRFELRPIGDFDAELEMAEIIDEYTTGRFVFDKTGISFENEKDALIFRLHYNGTQS